MLRWCAGAAPEIERALLGGMKLHRSRRGLTLAELLAALAIVAVLTALVLPAVGHARRAAHQAASASNLRQLVLATLAFAHDHRGDFPPAMSLDNLRRWHGARASLAEPFDPALGWLGPYLGRSGAVKRCPGLGYYTTIAESPSFEQGAGGYGYNMAYLGGPAARGTADDPFRPANIAHLRQPSHTVAFATTALARAGGVQEYPFAEPLYSLAPSGIPSAWMNQPSVHFRFAGRALVAWADGRVSAERPNPAAPAGPNFYGGDNRAQDVGWFGPLEANGYWNPRYPD